MPELWLKAGCDAPSGGKPTLAARSPSLFDEHLDDLLAMVRDLLTRRGAFHVKVHFSSNQLSVWFLDNPYNYQVYRGSEVIASDLMDVIPEQGFDGRRPHISDEQVETVLDEFKRLRRIEGDNYLSIGSIHRLNGRIGLTFSSEESCYLDIKPFLKRLKG